MILRVEQVSIVIAPGNFGLLLRMYHGWYRRNARHNFRRSLENRVQHSTWSTGPPVFALVLNNPWRSRVPRWRLLLVACMQIHSLLANISIRSEPSRTCNIPMAFSYVCHLAVLQVHRDYSYGFAVQAVSECFWRLDALLLFFGMQNYGRAGL